MSHPDAFVTSAVLPNPARRANDKFPASVLVSSGFVAGLFCALVGWCIVAGPKDLSPVLLAAHAEDKFVDSITVVHEANPLEAFVHASAQRGACTKSGVPIGFPIPWAMALATHGADDSSAPAVRQIGIQGVTAEAIYFVCRGGPGGAAGQPAGLNAYNASMVHLAGNFPGAGFEEQWRADGIVKEVPIGTLRELGLPPPDKALVTQVLASAAFAAGRAQSHEGSLAPTTIEGRLELTTDVGDDADALANDLAQSVARDGDSATLDADARHAGLRAYALVPRRMEVLRGRPQWPDGPIRFEWARTTSSTDRAPESRSSAAGLVWSTPRQILPYSWPGHA